jgi:EAL domain-containing protein (putative c-di-GMP-specific phosphodiesterase class I)
MLVDVATVRQALEHDELEACFQPIVELHTGQISGFEVLARWRAPGVGLVLPPNFISIAEQNGLIGLLMQQVLRKAFLAAPVIPESLFIAVNVSPLQLHDRSLPTQICSLANEAEFSIPRLVIEITESALVDNLEQARQIAWGLKEVGCSLALDDFGTGYSSLRHLQALPFDKLKVDGGFVKSMTETRESRKIVAAVVGLGHSLGLITVAECIETDEQADMLISLGCEMGQGWLYGRPVEADQIPRVIGAAPQELSRRLSKIREGGIVSSLEALPGDRLAQLQAIYDGAPVGLCFLDRNLRYVSLNRRLADLNDAPVAAHLGRTAQQMIPELFPRIEPFLRRALRGEAIPEVEISRPAFNTGDPDHTVVCTYQPAFDEVGEVIGVSVAVMDITEQRNVGKARCDQKNGFQTLNEFEATTIFPDSAFAGLENAFSAPTANQLGSASLAPSVRARRSVVRKA